MAKLLISATPTLSGKDAEKLIRDVKRKPSRAAPLQKLVAFKKEFIKVNEEKKIKIKIPAESMMYVNNEGRSVYVSKIF